jgi:FMN phosphatase YigB (HAD superfamily)
MHADHSTTDSHGSPTLQSPVRGIIFDLDGTLYNMKWYMRILFFVSLVPKGLWLPRYMRLRSMFSGKDFGSRDMLLNAMADRFVEGSAIKSIRVRDWFERSFYPGFVAIMPFFQGTRSRVNPTLAALRAKNIKLAVLSDFSRIKERLTALKIDPLFFDQCISSEDEGALKPNSRPFLKIANDWQFKPSEILVIGDRDDTDGEAARQCGFQFIQITDAFPPPANTYRWDTLRSFLLALQ